MRHWRRTCGGGAVVTSQLDVFVGAVSADGSAFVVWSFNSVVISPDVMDECSISGHVELTRSSGPSPNEMTVEYADGVSPGETWSNNAAPAQSWFDPDGPLLAGTSLTI